MLFLQSLQEFIWIFFLFHQRILGIFSRVPLLYFFNSPFIGIPLVMLLVIHSAMNLGTSSQISFKKSSAIPYVFFSEFLSVFFFYLIFIFLSMLVGIPSGIASKMLRILFTIPMGTIWTVSTRFLY